MHLQSCNKHLHQFSCFCNPHTSITNSHIRGTPGSFTSYSSWPTIICPSELKSNLDLQKPTSLQIYKHLRDFLSPEVIFSDTVYCLAVYLSQHVPPLRISATLTFQFQTSKSHFLMFPKNVIFLSRWSELTIMITSVGLNKSFIVNMHI